MMDDKAQTLQQRVHDVVIGILAKHTVAGPVGGNDELVKLGLTSIDMVELMLAVEGEFDIIIPPADITAENFRSVDTIGRMIGRLGGEAGETGSAAA